MYHVFDAKVNVLTFEHIVFLFSISFKVKAGLGALHSTKHFQVEQ